MTRPAATLCLLLAVLYPALAGQNAARADPIAEARAAIQQAHARIDMALSRKDIPGVTAPCAPNFVSINTEGERFNAAQIRTSLAKNLSDARAVESTTTIQDVTLTPTGATASIFQHMSVLSPYRVLFVHRLARTTIDQGRREQWVKTPQGWQLGQSKTLSSQQHTRL